MKMRPATKPIPSMIMVAHQPRLTSHLFSGKSDGAVLLSYGFGPWSPGSRICSFVMKVLHMGASKHKLNRLATVLCRFVWNGKEVVEAQGREPKGLENASCFDRAGFKLAAVSKRFLQASFPLQDLGTRYIAQVLFRQSSKTAGRVSPFSQRWHVSGGTSPRKRASDPLKRCTRLWAHLTAIYGAYGICATDAINRLTGRLVLDNGHGQVYGDLILCSPTAWYSLGTGNCGRRIIVKGPAHGH